jgi:hypothetical protein
MKLGGRSDLHLVANWHDVSKQDCGRVPDYVGSFYPRGPCRRLKEGERQLIENKCDVKFLDCIPFELDAYLGKSAFWRVN